MNTSAPSPPRTLVGVRVLLVDDDVQHLELLSVLLRQAGARVEAAQSAQEAFDSFLAEPPNVLVSDLAMPNTSGFNLIRRIRALPGGRDVPAVALSALPWQQARSEALQAGFTEWVSKPGADNLVAVVARLARG